jgi:hypothetical protein
MKGAEEWKNWCKGTFIVKDRTGGMGDDDRMDK